jgi:hypothetical protein
MTRLAGKTGASSYATAYAAASTKPLRMTYDDMLGGTEVRLRSDGYGLGPYTMLVAAPGLPLRLPVRCTDSCRLEPDGSLIDSIDLSMLGVRVGRQIMHLKPRTDH